MEVEHKAVRYLRLRVRQDGQVRLSAPLHAGRGEVQAFLRAREDWIRTQQQRFAAMPEPPHFEFRTGAALPFDGGRLRLARDVGRVACWRDGSTLRLRTDADADAATCRKPILAWYRRELAADLDARMPAWAEHMALPLPSWTIRNMRSRWGSCNPAARRINVALRLMAQPASCRDYVIVHELAHLRVAGHNRAFWAQVARAMPAWRDAHDALRGASTDAGLWL